MKTKWISHDHQMQPTHKQKVFFFSPGLGVDRASYDAVHKYFDGTTITASASTHLPAEGAYWRPDHGERVLPMPPEEYSGPGEEDGPWAPGYVERCSP
jgi:hypothetical protein